MTQESKLLPDENFICGAAACVVALYHGKAPGFLETMPSAVHPAYEGVFDPPGDECLRELYESFDRIDDPTADPVFNLGLMLELAGPVASLMLREAGNELGDPGALDRLLRLPLPERVFQMLEARRESCPPEERIHLRLSIARVTMDGQVEKIPALRGWVQQLMGRVARIVSAHHAEVGALARTLKERSKALPDGTRYSVIPGGLIMRTAGSAYRRGLMETG